MLPALRDLRDTVTVDEAAIVLGIGRTSAYKAVQRGDIPSIRIGRRLLVPRAAIEDMVGRRSGDAAR
ncbi:MAG: helix-turn-helix domain-containing protein [Thermoleophilia bacterium]